MPQATLCRRGLEYGAGQEVSQHPDRDPGVGQDFVGETAKSGVWADSVAMLALARALNVELRIFAWSDEAERWHLHELLPMKKSRESKTVWLALRDHHYIWLKVVARVPETVRKGATIIGGEDDPNQDFFEAHPSTKCNGEATGAIPHRAGEWGRSLLMKRPRMQ